MPRNFGLISMHSAERLISFMAGARAEHRCRMHHEASEYAAFIFQELRRFSARCDAGSAFSSSYKSAASALSAGGGGEEGATTMHVTPFR